MKKAFAFLVAVLLVFGCMTTAMADGLNPADQGWKAPGEPMDYTGWNMSENGDFNVSYFDTNATNGESARLWKGLITDKETFTIELDVIASGYTSPYVKVFGVELELDGNNGDGNQVYLKLDHNMLDWYACTNTECHVTIWRENGGDVNFLVEGKDNLTSVTLKNAVISDSDALEIGLYRGTAEFKNITCENGVAPEVEEETLPTITDPTTEPTTEPTQAPDNKPDNKPADDAQKPANDPTVWIIIGVSAAVIVVVAVIIIVSKKRGSK